MNEKVKEMKKAEKLRKNLRHGVGISSTTSISSNSSIPMGGGISLSSCTNGSSNLLSASTTKNVAPKVVTGGGKALKLGSKSTTDDNFLQQLRDEGQDVLSVEVYSRINFYFTKL